MTLLLIHTGGTIGMTPGPQGLTPEPGLVEAAIAARLPAGAALTAHVFAPLRDSADIGPTDWNVMLDVLEAHPGQPALITHGTDTMAFTGAALSQALAGAARRVVLCGAMHPLGQGGDAERNLDLALAAAQAPGVGVDLAFAGRLLPAAGLVKHDSRGADAFRSQPQDPGSPPPQRRFDPARRLAIVTLSPGLPAPALQALLQALDGAVLRVFGAGTVMHDRAILAVLAQAIAQGKRLRAVSQCEAGGLSPGAYAAGAALWDMGIENGGPETPEAALARLWLS
ncbi:aminopeptidase [Rhodobacter sp. TJ_12]|uniref:asparaginase n=1 Tax=Rhodobacter sp. TJ_12 TaxID=2029399 RepID=UPI001CBAAAD4|nr:asparaginase domain-containing protein [Rhodobacter sp. TJ_12]MBZ4021031.1 aminopeptidase [Rhodobacter sp. TJ_12]